jgi:YVTN family beta-propeller protein
VTNYSSNSVTPINVLTGAVGKAITVGSGPAGIAIAPNGKTAYVTDAGTTPIGDTVTPINLKTHKALAPITVGDGPQGIAITPDGSTAYVANAGGIVNGQNAPLGHSVTPIDLKTGVAGSPINVGNAPTAVVASSDGSTVYVANTGSGSVTPITVAGNAPGVPIGVTGTPQALAAAGPSVYVADDSASSPAGNNVTPIAIASSTAGSPIVTGANPTSIAITPNGKTAYVVCNGTDQLVTINLSTNALLKAQAISVPGGAYALALARVPATKISVAFGITRPKKKST